MNILSLSKLGNKIQIFFFSIQGKNSLVSPLSFSFDGKGSFIDVSSQKRRNASLLLKYFWMNVVDLVIVDLVIM